MRLVSVGAQNLGDDGLDNKEDRAVAADAARDGLAPPADGAVQMEDRLVPLPLIEKRPETQDLAGIAELLPEWLGRDHGLTRAGHDTRRAHAAQEHDRPDVHFFGARQFLYLGQKIVVVFELEQEHPPERTLSVLHESPPLPCPSAAAGTDRRHGHDPAILFPLIDPFIGKTAAEGEVRFFGPLHQVLIGLVHLSEDHRVST